MKIKKMLHNLNRSRGLIYSSKAINVLINEGIDRQLAYDIVQENALKVWTQIQNGSSGPCLLESLLADSRVSVSKEKLSKAFESEQFLESINKIFSRLD